MPLQARGENLFERRRSVNHQTKRAASETKLTQTSPWLPKERQSSRETVRRPSFTSSASAFDSASSSSSSCSTSAPCCGSSSSSMSSGVVKFVWPKVWINVGELAEQREG